MTTTTSDAGRLANRGSQLRAVMVAPLVALCLVTASPAHTAAAPTAGGPRTHCRHGLEIARGGATIIDPDEMTTLQILAANARLRQAETSLRQASGRGIEENTAGPDAHTVRVFVHVLRRNGPGAVSRARIHRQIAVMNHAYAGGQSDQSAVAPFRFVIAHIDVTLNPAWFGMDEGTRAEGRAKRALHRGDARDLNLYIADANSGVLGWATQPAQYAAQPTMDGVVVGRRTLPGGTKGHYSAGDVAVHETGHWLGLFHTFAGACGKRGDLVADTPPEARPSYTCPGGRDTCTAAGDDPIHNFMDYSYDSCMTLFTTGQVARMLKSWVAFRDTGMPRQRTSRAAGH